MPYNYTYVQLNIQLSISGVEALESALRACEAGGLPAADMEAPQTNIYVRMMIIISSIISISIIISSSSSMKM